MAAFTAQDVGRTKELRVGGVTVKAIITAVNTGSSLVSYTPVRQSPDPREPVGAPVANATFASITSQADWPSFAATGGRGQPGAGRYPTDNGRSTGAYPPLEPRTGHYPLPSEQR